MEANSVRKHQNKVEESSVGQDHSPDQLRVSSLMRPAQESSPGPA